jgi:selenide, water dikinase
MQSQGAIRQDLVLLGGGHSHAIVLQMWAMNPLPGVRLTLISDGADTPYSGMLPGHVAGFYDREACHIDLRSLCQRAGAQFYHDRAVGLDLAHQQVICAGRPPVGFDLLSIDIGSTPAVPSNLGPNAIAAKPVSAFLRWWDDLCRQSRSALTVGVIGGGVGGVELALSMQKRLQPQVEQLAMHLFSRSPTLLPQHNPCVQQRFQRLLTQREIGLHLGEIVKDWDGQVLRCASGLAIGCDVTVWVTQATAPDWLAKSGLAVDAAGFIAVDENLRSTSHPAIFATGDIAAMIHHPRPKAGVFAVRQGKPLFENLRSALSDRPLRPYIPQRQYLSLIGTADRSAVASRGPLIASGTWVWALKDRIDRRFMQRFQVDRQMRSSRHDALLHSQVTHPTLDLTQLKVPLLKGDLGGLSPAATTDRPTAMQCSGCGAKVGSSTLSRVLQRIQTTIPTNDAVLIGLDSPDDAAVLQVPTGKVLVQTIDYFPALIDDPFLLGQIAANHSLSDLFAMGADAQTAMAMATIPYGLESKQEETLFQLLSGAIKILQLTQTPLVGGHTIVGEKLMFGLSCNGFANLDQLLKKSGMQVGDLIVLTKPLGIGTLFAAQMRSVAKPQWIDAAIDMMLQSNFAAGQICLTHGATACTDVTGFGLLGHLVEMVRASGVSVTLNLRALPILPGALAITQQGIVSSLYAENQRSQNWIANLSDIATQPILPLLFDPQTSGGLIATVPPANCHDCLNRLRAAGYLSSCVIGSVTRLDKGALPIRITE